MQNDTTHAVIKSWMPQRNIEVSKPSLENNFFEAAQAVANSMRFAMKEKVILEKKNSGYSPLSKNISPPLSPLVEKTNNVDPTNSASKTLELLRQSMEAANRLKYLSQLLQNRYSQDNYDLSPVAIDGLKKLYKKIIVSSTVDNVSLINRKMEAYQLSLPSGKSLTLKSSSLLTDIEMSMIAPSAIGFERFIEKCKKYAAYCKDVIAEIRRANGVELALSGQLGKPKNTNIEPESNHFDRFTKLVSEVQHKTFEQLYNYHNISVG